MGLSIQFYAEDEEMIGTAFSAVDFDQLRDGRRSIAYADLSLHVGLEDLDLLSTTIADHARKPGVALLDGFGANVGAIDGEGSADVVDPQWVALVGTLEAADAPAVAAEWIRQVGQSRGKHLEPTDAAAEAVENLIALCKKAIAKNADVVCVWYLCRLVCGGVAAQPRVAADGACAPSPNARSLDGRERGVDKVRMSWVLTLGALLVSVNCAQTRSLPARSRPKARSRTRFDRAAQRLRTRRLWCRIRR